MNAPDLFYQNYSVLGSPVFGEAYILTGILVLLMLLVWESYSKNKLIKELERLKELKKKNNKDDDIFFANLEKYISDLHLFNVKLKIHSFNLSLLILISTFVFIMENTDSLNYMEHTHLFSKSVIFVTFIYTYVEFRQFTLKDKLDIRNKLMQSYTSSDKNILYKQEEQEAINNDESRRKKILFLIVVIVGIISTFGSLLMKDFVVFLVNSGLGFF